MEIALGFEVERWVDGASMTRRSAGSSDTRKVPEACMEEDVEHCGCVLSFYGDSVDVWRRSAGAKPFDGGSSRWRHGGIAVWSCEGNGGIWEEDA